LGPAAAVFYRQPALREVLVAMGAASFVGSLENIGTVYFRRDFAFHKEFLIRSSAKLVGFCVTVAIALKYRSYWALVAGVLAIKCVTVGASYVYHPFRPKLSLKNARELFGFSSWLLFGNMIEYCREKFGDLFIGRVYGTATNGLFAVAGEISIVPLTEVVQPINRAAYSKYAEDVRANRGLGPSYLSIAPLIWMVSLPIAAGIAAVSPEIIRLLLGPQWQAAEAVLRWLALGTAFTVMTANTHYVYWALGHSRVGAALSLAGVVMIVPLTFVFSRMVGYTGVAIAFACASAALIPINFTILRRLAGIEFVDLWERVWRIALATIVMSITLWLAFTASGSANAKTALVLLLAKAAVGVVTYTGTVWMAWVARGKPVGPERATLNVLRGVVARFVHGQAADVT
jgi:O-antigen/teichoic acid export membrane protein